jgi:hypothetical protein
MSEYPPGPSNNPDNLTNYLWELTAGFKELPGMEHYEVEAEQVAPQEVQYETELQGTLDVLDAYKKIQSLLGWLAEASANAPLLKGVKRAQLHRLLQGLGIDPDDPQAFLHLESIRQEMADSNRTPKPVLEVPGVDFFEARINEIISGERRSKLIRPVGLARPGEVNLVDVVRYGHTVWQNVTSRTADRSTAQWVHDIAVIMADPVAYKGEFDGLATGRGYEDRLAIDPDWGVQNGRHRTLAAVCLGEEYVRTSRMDSWVEVVVED